MAANPKDSNIFSLPMLQQVIDYIEENLFEKLTPSVIAAHFYMSESTLSSLFRIVCEMTIMEYMRNRRLTLAAEELSTSNIPIIELAYKYGYETPEAFTKAFSRFHGFPPSFVRRGFPISNQFLPMKIEVRIQGGWRTAELTKSNGVGQDHALTKKYNTFSANKEESDRDSHKREYNIDVEKMQFQKEWRILYSLAQKLSHNHISFKIDGKTMIFAHGLEIPLDKICLTFKWKDEGVIKNFFYSDMSYDSVETKYNGDSFKYFDVMYEKMKIRCMFYGNCLGDHTDEFLYKNTDFIRINDLTVPVQSLEFYCENAEKNSEYYKMVEEWLGRHERL